MGIFDMVWVDCPHCGKPVEFQSKAMDDAYMRRFTIDDAPEEILRDIINRPEHCMACDKWMALIDPNFRDSELTNLRPVKVKTPENPTTHFQGMKWWPENMPFTYDDLIDPPSK